MLSCNVPYSLCRKTRIFFLQRKHILQSTMQLTSTLWRKRAASSVATRLSPFLSRSAELLVVCFWREVSGLSSIATKAPSLINSPGFVNFKQNTKTFCTSNYYTTSMWNYNTMYVQRKIEARSQNHCCRGKASITYFCVRARASECVRVRMCACGSMDAGVRLHACSLTFSACNAPPYCQLRPLINVTIFGKRSLNITCVLRFFLRHLSTTFLVLRIEIS